MNLDDFRLEIDEAVDAWLRASGLTPKQILALDYSDLDTELNNLLTLGAEL